MRRRRGHRVAAAAAAAPVTAASGGASAGGEPGGFLSGVRVVELADETGEYAGKLLAGLGADVVKVEPPGGEASRAIGPFVDDRPGPDRSLFFWHYDHGKRSVVLDPDRPGDRRALAELVARADVFLTTRPTGELRELGLDPHDLRSTAPGLVVGHLSPFGETGPWRSFQGSDLVHLALGGVMMNCGYDPDPDGHYDTPPIAPQMWHSIHIAGEMLVIGVLGALYDRRASGEGQVVSTSVHQAVAQQTETDVPNWVFSRRPHYRRTCRHSFPDPDDVFPEISATKDGRWILPYRSYTNGEGTKELEATAALLDRHGMADDLTDPRYLDPDVREQRSAGLHIQDVVGRFIRRFLFSREIWRDAQEVGCAWGPLRRPEENVTDDHWRARHTFFEVDHPELGRTCTEVGAKWYCEEVPWRAGPRAPLLGEHTAEILAELDPPAARAGTTGGAGQPGLAGQPGRAGQPGLAERPSSRRRHALEGVRMVDLGWLLASAGAGRFLTAMGAEVIKIEHRSRLDPMRWNNGIVPPGGRAQRLAATEPIVSDRPESPNRSGFFMEINAGKRAASLNLKHPRGRELLGRLISMANVVAEGFSPGTMRRMGFGYDVLQELRPGIVYAQQSGMGETGTYGQMRSYGPVAQGFSGLSEMSGLPEPYPPAGIGYSFLDWYGAYNLATAIMAGVVRQQRTGLGCWIDSSQVESGIYLTGTAVLDFAVNGRSWTRSGNRSPYRAAVPHDAFPAAGEDRWVAIACFDDHEWRALVETLGSPAWAADGRFASVDGRKAHEDRLYELVATETRRWDPYELMARLQAAGVRAGVCQTAEDRVDRDPQLAHLGWMVELPQSEIGTWPCKQFPAHLSRTPPSAGGTVGRHGPSYAEDNEYVYGELLGLSSAAIAELAEDGAI